VSETPEPVRPPRRGLRKSVYVIPSLFTTANIFCGFSAVILSVGGSVALSTGNVAEAILDFDIAAKFIGWAVLFDFLDGRVARMTNSTTQFGVEFDSIADVLTFGIAPAMLAYCWGYGFIPELVRLPWAISFLYLICGALRLARFNVQASKPALQKPGASPKLDKKAFVGMPIPAGASLIAAIVHYVKLPVSQASSTIDLGGRQIVIDSHEWAIGLLVLVVCLSLLMVSTFRYTAFKSVGPRSRNPRLVILLIAVMLSAVYYYSEITLLLLATVYAAHGVVGKVVSLIRRFVFPHHQETVVRGEN
jgi:CDP-diacylglycerol--serine O-phosphatidyltransferase